MNILLAEDDLNLGELLSNFLKSKGYSVDLTRNGKLAFERFNQKKFDFCIFDVMMPEMDGFTLAKEIRELDKKVPILFLTAKAMKEDKLEGFALGADDYLTKPFDREELNVRVQSLLDIRKLIQLRLTDSLFQESTPTAEFDGITSKVNPSTQLEQQTIFLKKLDQQLADLYQDSELKIETIASGLCMSQRQLYRKLKGILDLTQAEYLKYYRLDRAKTMLSQGQTASRVALDVGFATHSHFSKSFKLRYGCVPSEYKS